MRAKTLRWLLWPSKLERIFPSFLTSFRAPLNFSPWSSTRVTQVLWKRVYCSSNASNLCTSSKSSQQRCNHFNLKLSCSESSAIWICSSVQSFWRSFRIVMFSRRYDLSNSKTSNKLSLCWRYSIRNFWAGSLSHFLTFPRVLKSQIDSERN